MTVPVFNMTDIWADGGTTFTAIKMNITNTASNVNSLLMDLQIGGSSWFSVGYNAGNPMIALLGIRAIELNGGALYFSPGGQSPVFPGFIQLSQSLDAVLWRDAANTVAQRNGTNAQTFRVYNTFTDTSNYERGVFDWTTTANALTIGMQKAGTGISRNVNFVTNGVGVFTFDSQVQVGAIVNSVYIDGTNGVKVGSGLMFQLGDATPGASKWSISRVVDKVAAFGDGAANANGWMQWAGQARVTSDFSKTSDTTLANVTGLSVTLQGARTYSFFAELPCTCATAGGVKFAVSGTASFSAITYTAYVFDGTTSPDVSAIRGFANATAKDTVVAQTTTTGTTPLCRITGTCTLSTSPDQTGTLTIQFAQSASNGTASVVKAGAYLVVHDMP